MIIDAAKDLEIDVSVEVGSDGGWSSYLVVSR